MPIIRIDLLEGRTIEQKKKLAEAITTVVMEILGVERNIVTIIFNDLPKTNLAKGGILASEIKSNE